MALFFRKLQQKRNWDSQPWLGDRQVPADALKCFRTIENKLSVFILDDPDLQLGRVVAAMTLTQDELRHFDYALAPESVLEECKIKTERTLAETPDNTVNKWHKDLVELTTDEIVKLAAAIRQNSALSRCIKPQVQEMVKASIEARQIEERKINPKLAISLRNKQIIE